MEGNNDKSGKSQKSWEEVGDKFTAFGESLGEALSSTWNDPKTQEVLEQLKNGLHQAADEIEDAIQNAKEDPGVKQFREEAAQAFNDLGEKGEEVVQNVRPHVMKALKSFSEALNQLIGEMEKDEE
ncbi:MAG: hypothetical protein V2J07_10710 [Anaerolineae bacterium]|jgi:ABC-type transporter Mla subunit MlaD|nr:hypothetical protein [Anaerolineae bacterium]